MSPGGGGLSSPLSLHCPVLAAASVCDWPVLVLSCSLSPSSERGGAQPSAQGAALTPPGYQPLGTGSGPDPWDPGPSAGRSLPSPAATSPAPATFHLRPCDPGQTRPGGTGLVPSPVGACPPTPLSLPGAWVVGCHRWENGRPCPAAPSSPHSPVQPPALPPPLSPPGPCAFPPGSAHCAAPCPSCPSWACDSPPASVCRTEAPPRPARPGARTDHTRGAVACPWTGPATRARASWGRRVGASLQPLPGAQPTGRAQHPGPRGSTRLPSVPVSPADPEACALGSSRGRRAHGGWQAGARHEMQLLIGGITLKVK